MRPEPSLLGESQLPTKCLFYLALTLQKMAGSAVMDLHCWRSLARPTRRLPSQSLCHGCTCTSKGPRGPRHIAVPLIGPAASGRSHLAGPCIWRGPCHLSDNRLIHVPCDANGLANLPARCTERVSTAVALSPRKYHPACLPRSAACSTLSYFPQLAPVLRDCRRPCVACFVALDNEARSAGTSTNHGFGTPH